MLIVSCGGDNDTLTSTARTTETAVTSTNAAERISVATTAVQTAAVVTAQTTPGTLQLIEGDTPVFQVVSSMELFKNSFFNKKIDDFCLAVRDIGVTRPTYTYDQARRMTYEILIGKTNRDVKLPELDALEWVVMVQGTKVILYSETDYGLLDAIGLDRSKVCTYCWTGEE